MRIIHRRRTGLAFGVALASALIASCAESPPETAPPAADDRAPVASPRPAVSAPPGAPNIVVLSIGALRPDHLGCYGYRRPTSPRIDQLARDSALFENVISSTAWSLPAHAALFTALADSVHGCVDIDRRLDDSRRTLAERLHDRGYATAGFFAGPYLHPAFGLAQGFDAYVDGSAPGAVTSPGVTAAALGWLREERDRPFFLFVHLRDIAADIELPAPFDTMIDAATGAPIERYDRAIAWTDQHVGQILDEIDARGLRGETIVVLTADHGTELLERGTRGPGRTLRDEMLRIPLLLRYPDRVLARRFGDQVRIVDVTPTLLHLALDEVPTDIMGQVLTPLWHEGYLAEDNLAISELLTGGRRERAYRRNDRKLVMDEVTNEIAIFNLRADRDEQRGSAAIDSDEPWITAALRDRDAGGLRLARFDTEWPIDPTPPDLPDGIRKRLERLERADGREDADRP